MRITCIHTTYPDTQIQANRWTLAQRVNHKLSVAHLQHPFLFSPARNRTPYNSTEKPQRPRAYLLAECSTALCLALGARPRLRGRLGLVSRHLPVFCRLLLQRFCLLLSSLRCLHSSAGGRGAKSKPEAGIRSLRVARRQASRLSTYNAPAPGGWRGGGTNSRVRFHLSAFSLDALSLRARSS